MRLIHFVWLDAPAPTFSAETEPREYVTRALAPICTLNSLQQALSTRRYANLIAAAVCIEANRQPRSTLLGHHDEPIELKEVRPQMINRETSHLL